MLEYVKAWLVSAHYFSSHNERRSTKFSNFDWPTPRTKHLCGGTGAYQKLLKNLKEEKITPVEFKAMAHGIDLNPNWVEWLMGIPQNWT